MAMDGLHAYALFVVLPVFLGLALGAPASDVADSTDGPIDGQYLVNLGRKFNYPLLRLIGRVVMNNGGGGGGGQIEQDLIDKMCHLHPCGEWEQWTDCPVKRGFSVVTRSRVCHKPTDICAYDGKAEYTTSESQVCMGAAPACPPDYNSTNGFCLKLYKSGEDMTDAKKICQEDGGYVIRINSQAKTDAVGDLLESYGYTTNAIWLNGERTTKGGSWTFTYGVQTTYSNWKDSEPSNGSTEMCMVEESDPRVWWDRECNNNYKFICEVP